MKTLKPQHTALLRAAATGVMAAALLFSTQVHAPLTALPVTAEAVAKKITLKPDTDFILTAPANWKGNYVIEKSKNRKHSSYVSISAKKCRKEKADGGLFTILRYKDTSFEDELPEYELVGKWGGMYYIAAFPTEKQTIGASKAAKKQYNKLSGGTYATAFSIRPAKKRESGNGIYCASDFSLKLPEAWTDGSYKVYKKGKKTENGSYVAFYAAQCQKENGEGFLFAIERFTDKSYEDLPNWEIVGIWNNITYVATFPTDVQYEGVSTPAIKQYRTFEKTAHKAARSILR